MRFIGNKENLVSKIHQILESNGTIGHSFFDFFAGTSSVGRFFKSKNYQIISSDLLYFSFVLQKAYIENNDEPHFTNLLPRLKHTSFNLFATPLEIVVEFLNHVPPKHGFIYTHYTPEGSQHLEIPRMYFSNENGAKIDAIRDTIEEWKIYGWLSDNEYYILLACLIESVPFYANIAGVFAAFHKKWDVRAIKKFVLRPISIIKSEYEHSCFNTDSMNLIQKNTDILYLDPPYNQRQYAPNYHILETIAKNDNPIIKGVSGMRSYNNQKSQFCNTKSALECLYQISHTGNYKTLVLSYNDEGIMSSQSIIDALKQCGSVSKIEFEYPRFKSNNNGESASKKLIKEQLYILQK